MTCRKVNALLADVLLEPQSVPDEVRKHLTGCTECAARVAAIEATMLLLDEWRAPEPTAFFDAKLYARLRAEEATASAGFLERVKAWVLYSTNLPMRQLGAGALAAVLAIGGGTFVVVGRQPAPSVRASATVRDLQSYDRNAKLFQQLNTLEADDGSVVSRSN